MAAETTPIPRPVRLPRMLPAPLTPRPRALAAIALALIPVALAMGGCGGDEGMPGGPTDPERWRAQVELMCSDGSQEAVALPLPQAPREIGADAEARAEIVTTVRDGILPLPPRIASGSQTQNPPVHKRLRR